VPRRRRPRAPPPGIYRARRAGRWNSSLMTAMPTSGHPRAAPLVSTAEGAPPRDQGRGAVLCAEPAPHSPAPREGSARGHAGRVVYEKYFAFVWRSVRRLGVGDSAVDDAVQEIFVVVHRRLADFEERASIKTWLYGIVLRVVRHHRRTLRRKPAQ